jgi:hypothetical protein
MNEVSELRDYIFGEGQGYLSLPKEILNAGGGTMGYRCWLHLEADGDFAVGVVELYSLEQAKLVVHEALRQQVRFLAAKVTKEQRDRERRKAEIGDGAEGSLASESKKRM